MEYALTILNQLITMVFFIVIGYILHATKLVSKEGNKTLATLLLYVFLPSVIIQSFFREANAASTRNIVIALVAGAALVALSMGVSHLCFRKNPVDDFSASFSNAGFMGIPLITSVLGADQVFYIAGFVALLNILQWTYGQHLLSGGKKAPLKTALKGLINPLVIAFALGLICYFTQLRLPSQIESCITAVSKCNTPIAMFILGFYLREMPFKKIFSVPKAFLVALVRLVLIPLLSLALIAWIPVISPDIKRALLIAAAAPVGTNVAIYAAKHNADVDRSLILICLTTILCIVTMPAMMLLMNVVI